MGCDGGTIPKRHELVKGPKKVEKVSDVGPAGPGVGGAPGSEERWGWGRRLQTQLRSFPSCGEFSMKTKLIPDLYCVPAVAAHAAVPLIWGASCSSHIGPYCRRPHLADMGLEGEREHAATLATAPGFEACLP